MKTLIFLFVLTSVIAVGVEKIGLEHEKNENTKIVQTYRTIYGTMFVATVLCLMGIFYKFGAPTPNKNPN